MSRVKKYRNTFVAGESVSHMTKTSQIFEVVSFRR